MQTWLWHIPTAQQLLLGPVAGNRGHELVERLSWAGQLGRADVLPFSMQEEGPNPGNNVQGVRNPISEQESSLLFLSYKIHPVL